MSLRLNIHNLFLPTNECIYNFTQNIFKTFENTLKHSDMFRSCQITIRELCSSLKLYYSIHNSIRICKRGVVAAYQVVEQWLGVRRMLSNKRL